MPAPFDSLTLLPFQLAGSVHRSPMPFGSYDPGGGLMVEIERAGIDVVVPLASEEECRAKSGRALHALYRSMKLEVVRFPITDFGVPEEHELAGFIATVDTALARAKAGRHVLVHCSAGIGRTGTFLASMVIRELGLSAPDAIQWVRKHVRGAVERRERSCRPGADHVGLCRPVLRGGAGS